MIIRITNGLSNATVVNSEIVAHSLVGRRVVRRKQMVVIPNGIMMESPGEPVLERSSLGIPENSFLWIVVGRLEPQKDHETLLDAFSILGKTDHHLLVAGNGSLMDRLCNRAQALGVSERVHFLGHVDNIRDLMLLSDALVLSSAWEGLPNVIMEAQALGLPVVATDVGGVRELVLPDRSGIIVQARSKDDLSDAMLHLSGLSTLKRKAMGEAGRHHISAQYEISRVVDRWEALIFDCDGRG